MVNIELYICQLMNKLKDNFGNRLLYVGLQGSYLRGEATPDSDLDIMVILESLDVSDLERYRGIVSSMDHADKSCGFICAREDLANWNPLEIWSLVNGTKDYFGKLEDFIPAYSRLDILNYSKMSLNNLYHELCHRYIHGNPNRTAQVLPGLYKSTFYILQCLHYLDHGYYIGTKKELLSVLEGKARSVLKISMHWDESDPAVDRFELLFSWCQEALRNV